MTPSFAIRVTPRFERLATALLKRHPEFRPLLSQARDTLGADPYNQTRTHHIKKQVELVSCGLRREDTYR